MSAPPSRLGPYVLEGLLGRGGMGAVFRGRHATLGVVRAIKVFAAAGAGPGKERFAREARTLAEVRHPGVVAVHDSGLDEGGKPWFAMDLVEGEALDVVLQRGRLPLARALDVAIQVARGVDALHAAGVVHRDLKPANVVVTPDGRAVVLDLGLAIAPDRDERLTRSGTMVGTPYYMAPEQVAGERPTPATDVHALGLLLFELVTGEVALGTESSVHHVVGRILAATRPRPSEVDPSLPAALDAVATRAMARAPADRYPRAGALADALEAVRAAPGPSAADARRARRALQVLAGVALAVAAAGLGLVAARALRRAPPGPGAAPGPGPAATGSASAPRAALTAEERAEAERDLRALRRLGPGARHEAGQAWLARWPGHPAADEVRLLLRGADEAAPRCALDHRARGDTFGRFLDGAQGVQAVTVGGDGTFRHWALLPPGESSARRADVARGAAESWREVARWQATPTRSLAIRGDRRLVAAALHGGMLVRLEPFDTAPAVDQAAFVGDARALAFAADGKRLVAADFVGAGGAGRPERPDAVRVVDVAERRIADHVGAARSPARDAVITRAGLVIVGYGAGFDEPDPEQAVKAFTLEEAEPRWKVRTLTRVTCLALSADERLVAAGTTAGQVVVIPLDRPGEHHELLATAFAERFEAGLTDAGGGQAQEIVALAWSPDAARLFALRLEAGRALLDTWDPAARRLARAPVPVGRPCRSLDVAPDGHRLLVGTTLGRVEVWSTGE